MGQFCNLSDSILYYGINKNLAFELHKKIYTEMRYHVIQVDQLDMMISLLPSKCIKIIDYQHAKEWVKNNLPNIHNAQLNIVFINTNKKPQYIPDSMKCLTSEASLSEIVDCLKKRMRAPNRKIACTSHLFKLTPKEKLVYSMIMEGKSNQEIAHAICRSVHTVKTHIYNLYQKLDVTNRVQAINKAYEEA